MAYNEQLANRIRHAFGTRNDITERKMFGGLAFLYRGRMCCGIVGSDLPARRDLFEANTFWELTTHRVTAEQTTRGEWRVTLDVQARKTAVETEGVDTDVPMNDFIEIGVFAAAGEWPGDVLYLEKHRVRSGAQRITVTVAGKPAQAGVDPRRLLIDLKPDDMRRRSHARRTLRRAGAID